MARRAAQSEVRAAEHSHKWDDVAYQIDRIECYYGVRVALSFAVEQGGKSLVVRTTTTPLDCPESLRVLKQLTTSRYTAGDRGIDPALALIALMKHQSELGMMPSFWGEGSEAMTEVKQALAAKGE